MNKQEMLAAYEKLCYWVKVNQGLDDLVRADGMLAGGHLVMRTAGFTEEELQAIKDRIFG